jgi:hypothetical protein
MMRGLFTEDDFYRHEIPLSQKHQNQSQHSDKASTVSSSPSSTTTTAPTSRWSVGKISVLILACLSLTDIIFQMVDEQMHSLEAPDHYDALSADVIRPAFRYHHHHHGGAEWSSKRQRRPSMGLGSAAISSVTTALSPILPFTGGIDLRREDYWTNGWFGSVSSVLKQVRDAFEEAAYTKSSSSSSNDAMKSVLDIPSGGSTSTKTKSKSATTSSSKSKHGSASSAANHNFVFSNADPFAPLKEIADLTLKDVAMSFRFAVENTRQDFNSGKFLSGLLPRAKRIVDRMSTATAMARGKGVAPPVTRQGDPPVFVSGDIDALSFCAAMRVFAEWRILRQVPPGYKGYSVGMTLGQKDVVQNLAKIEQAIHSYVDHRTQENAERIKTMGDALDSSSSSLNSPTLRELLQFEVDTNVQDVSKLPRLKEKSAAMGLLWVRRQLQYQTAIFANVIDVPKRFESTRAAVQSAYDEVYNKYHGWAVQKIFSYSFQAAPDGSEIYKYMNPHRLEEVLKEAQARFIVSEGGNDRRHGFRKSVGDLDSDHPLERFGRHLGREWDKVAGNVVQEWDKLAKNVAQLFGQQAQPSATLPQILSSVDIAASEEQQRQQETTIHVETNPATKELEIENYINHEMEKDAYEHILSYLEVAVPLLDDLESLIKEFNMDDPTKV